MQRIAVFLPNLGFGGAETIALNQCRGFLSKGLSVDLVIAGRLDGYEDMIPKGVNVSSLNAERVSISLFRLIKYLKGAKPDVIVSHMTHANIVAIISGRFLDGGVRVVVVEHTTPSINHRKNRVKGLLLIKLMKFMYSWADAVVAVSKGVAIDVQNIIGCKAVVRAIHNPIVDEELYKTDSDTDDVGAPVLGSNIVYLAVGRLEEEKDYPTLIRAFSLVRRRRKAKLHILGEGSCRKNIEALVKDLGVEEDIYMPGNVRNPYAYMRHATALVLSSRWEGFPTVLVEALACGCPVISADCRSGPREFLENGKYGALVPVGDVCAFAREMELVLDRERNSVKLMNHAQKYSISNSVNEYLRLFDSLQ